MRKEERLERAWELTDSYKALIGLLSNGEVMSLTEEKYRSIFAPWRKAAKNLNLALRKGRTYTANNRFRFPFIPLPENVTFLSRDLGGSIWFPVGEIIIVHIRYDAASYIVTPVDTIRSDQWDYLRTHSLFRKAFLNLRWPPQISVDLEVKESKNCLSEDCLAKLFQAYWHQLSCSLFLLDSVPLFNISMWTDFHGSKALSYHVSKDTDLFFPPETPLDIFRYNALWQSDLFRILFAATVFSITKPILQAAGLPVDFVLNLERKNGTAEDFKYYVHEWFCLLCKVITVKDKNSIEKLYKIQSFEFTDARYADMVSSASHHGFPYLYSREHGFHKDEEDKEKDTANLRPKTFFTSREINKLRRLRNLPILLSASEVNHQYPDEKCLTISPILDFGSRDARFHNKKTRDDLLDLYSGLLQYLSEQNEQNSEKCGKETYGKEFVTQKIKANARNLYKTSIKQLGVSPHEEPNLHQQHTACILTALAFLRQYIEAAFPKRDLSGPLGCIFHVEQRFRKMAGIQTAGLAVFAAFLKSLENSRDNSLIFTQDDDYLYLHYKEYWPAFEAYCKERSISIQYSAARFRRDILAPDFLKAQYRPANGKYPRFDYRKKFDKKEATVIAVSKKVISEFAPNEEKTVKKRK